MSFLKGLSVGCYLAFFCGWLVSWLFGLYSNKSNSSYKENAPVTGGVSFFIVALN